MDHDDHPTRVPIHRWRVVGLAVSVVFIAVYSVALSRAIHRGDQRARLERQQQEAILARLDVLESENKALLSQVVAATTQANTSVGQLTASGQAPIISAPGVITVPTDPSTTTTMPPVIVTTPVPERTTTTTEPPTTTSTTTTTATTAPPETTTTQPPESTTTEAPSPTVTVEPSPRSTTTEVPQ